MITINTNDLLYSFLFLIYFVVFTPFISYLLKKIGFPIDVCRKSTHIFFGLSSYLATLAFQNWYASIIPYLLLGVFGNLAFLITPIKNWYVNSMDRSDGSGLQRQATIMPLAFISLIVICWGVGQAKEYFVLGIVSWAVSDAAASLVGKKWGRRHFKFSNKVHSKTLEGSIAMFIGASLSIQVVSFLYGSWDLSTVIIGLVIAFLATVVELVSTSGFDNLTVSLVIGVFSLIFRI